MPIRLYSKSMKKLKRDTVNVRLYKDTHDILKVHSELSRIPIVTIVHNLALVLTENKSL